MSGNISITIDAAALKAGLKGLTLRAKQVRPVLLSIGEDMLEVTEQRFSDQKGPDGQKWTELSDVTKLRKKDQRILHESLTLRGSINYRVVNKQLGIGSNLVYAATHQFGRGEISSLKTRQRLPAIPARPYLGWTPANIDDALEDIRDFLSKDFLV